MEIRIKTADEFRNAHVVIEVRAEEGEDVRVRPLVAERLYMAAEVGAAQASGAIYGTAPLRHRIAELEAKVSELQAKAHAYRLDRTSETERAQRLEAELDRYRKAHVCTSRCSEKSHVAFEGNRIVKDLEAELARRTEERDKFKAGYETAEAEAGQARRQILDLGEEIVRQRERADRATEWAERAEGRLATAGVELADAQNVIDRQAAQLGRISGAVHGQEIVQAALRTGWTSWTETQATALTGAVRAVRDALGSPSPPGSPEPVTSQA